MGKDTRAANARRREESRLRASGIIARRAARDPREAGPAGGISAHELTEPALEAWGRAIGAQVRTPVVFALHGELGAGKSVFARAVARGAGVTTAMPSPTFNLLFRYETARGVTVSHLDLYRLEDPAEVWELGWRELGDANEIVLIEWPERAEHLLPPRRWDVFIEPGSTPNTRIIRVLPSSDPPELPSPQAS